MKMPVSVESAYIPMEAGYLPPLQEQRRKRDQYWKMLYDARQEFLKVTDQAPTDININSGAFFYYLKQHYGLQVETIDGNITGEYAVVDEKKYLLFLMKFGS